MKKSVFLTLSLVICSFTANIALAEQQIVITADSLEVYKVEVIKTLIAKYPKPPIQVPVDTGLIIMRSGQGQYVEKTKPQTKYSFWPLSIPVIKSFQSFNQHTWEYASGKWLPSTLFTVFIQPLEFDLWSSIFALYIVLLCILIISFANRFLEGIKERNQKLLIFYASILSVCVLASLLGYFINDSAGISAGVIAGISAGFLSGLFAGGSTGFFAGLFAGLLSGLFAGDLARENPKTVINYIIFLFFVCLVSYLLAILASNLKTRFFTRELPAQPEVAEK